MYTHIHIEADMNAEQLLCLAGGSRLRTESTSCNVLINHANVSNNIISIIIIIVIISIIIIYVYVYV